VAAVADHDDRVASRASSSLDVALLVTSGQVASNNLEAAPVASACNVLRTPCALKIQMLPGGNFVELLDEHRAFSKRRRSTTEAVVHDGSWRTFDRSARRAAERALDESRSADHACAKSRADWRAKHPSRILQPAHLRAFFA